MDPTHAPSWREPPRRIGPLVSSFEEPAKRLEERLVGATYVIAAAPMIAAAGVWLADWWLGHL